VTFRLDLRLYPVFHCSLLEPCATSTIPNCVVPPPPLVLLADGLEYEVVAILASKIIRNQISYLVDWLGYSPNDRTEEPATNVSNAQDLVDAFNRRCPTQPSLSSLPTRITRHFKRGIVS
jgi:hypothetical protein